MNLKMFIKNRIRFLLSLFVLLVGAFSFFIFFREEKWFESVMGVGCVIGIPFFWCIGSYLKDSYKIEMVDESWVNDQFRKVLAQKYKNSAPLLSIGDHNFQLKDKENLSKNRSFLKTQINSLESNKREFVRQFEPIGKRADYKKIDANYSTILTEYDEAIATLSKTLAETEQNIRKYEEQETSEKRGTPEFSESKEKFVPPTQPNWD